MHVLLEIVENFNAIESVQTCLNEIFLYRDNCENDDDDEEENDDVQ